MKFTVAIPAYKASYLKECIESILSQTESDFELIIVNDASPEDIESIVDEFSDNRIKYYKNETNTGALNVVLNWNICLSYASGDFFILMGDDDVLAINCLEEYSKLIKDFPNLDVYHCRSKIIDKHSKVIDVTAALPNYETVYDNMLHRIRGLRQQYISDFLYRTSFLKNNNGFYNLPLAWASDDISSYIAMGKKGVAHSNNFLFNYRRSSITISASGNDRFKMDALLKEDEWYKQFLKQKPSDSNNLLFYHLLENEIPKYIRKKKIRTIVSSLFNGGYVKIFFWIKRQKKYTISLIDITYAVIEYNKQKRSLKDYEKR